MFSKVAVNGVVDDMALVVAMCELHFRLKKHVPGVTRTPTREAVREVLVGFDANRDGVLDEAEFRRFAKQVRARGRGVGMWSGNGCGEECGEEFKRLGLQGRLGGGNASGSARVRLLVVPWTAASAPCVACRCSAVSVVLSLSVF